MANDADLPAGARPAWRAYREMCASKQAYFDLLSRLEESAASGPPTLAQQAQLARLLEQHDARVKDFNSALAGLTDPADREALLRRLQAD